MKKELLLLCMLLLSTCAIAQTYEWGGKFGGDGEDVALSMFTDASGNTYTTGYFTNNCDFDPTDGSFIISTGDDFDIFVQKTDTNGNLIWAKKMGGPASDYGTKVTADVNGNVYVTGEFQETADLDPGTGNFAVTSTGGLDIFVVKLTPEGNFTWAKTFSGPEYEESTGIGTDAAGNVYLSGYFYNPVDFDPGNTEFEMTPAGFGDGFAVKLSAEGNFVWARKFGGVEFDLATGLAVTADGSMYISGNYTGDADFDPSDEGTFVLTTDAETNGVFLLQLNSEGDFVKAVKAGQANNELYGYSVAVNAAGDAFIGGYFGGDLVFNINGSPTTFTSSDYYNSYVVKIKSDGSIAWAKQAVSTMMSIINTIAVNSLGEAVVSGYFNGTLTLDQLSYVKQNNNDSESFVAKFEANGNVVAASRFGGINFIDRCSIAVDGNDNIYLCGAFENTVDINPDPGMDNTVTSSGFRDNYLIKLTNEILSAPTASGNNVITVYPNPASSYITVNNIQQLQNNNYSMYDIMGRLVLSGTCKAGEQINLSTLSVGSYIFKIDNRACKIIKE